MVRMSTAMGIEVRPGFVYNYDRQARLSCDGFLCNIQPRRRQIGLNGLALHQNVPHMPKIPDDDGSGQLYRAQQQ